MKIHHTHFKDQPATFAGLNAYACETLSPGLLFLEFKDAVQEGDDNLVICVFKYVLFLFKVSSCSNYAIVASNLPSQLAEQIKGVYVHGRTGQNIGCNLHNMEQSNRTAQVSIGGLAQTSRKGDMPDWK